MSALKTWLTKEEVLRDLTEATGTSFGDLDEGYLVVGEKPPPKHVIEENDDEVNMLFGGLVMQRNVQDNSSPDLEGITEMLRMVNNYDNVEDGNDNGLVNPADTIITISKVTTLDPNVQEFVPKYAVHSSSCSDNLDSKSLNNNIRDINTKMTENKTGINIKENVAKTIVNNDKSNNFKMLTAKLKKQINDSSESDSFEHKKQKTLAIATLLKLYAKAPTGTQGKTSESQHTVKLRTPEDFQIIPNGKVLVTEQPSHEINKSLAQEGTSDGNDSKPNNGSCSTHLPNTSLSPEERASIAKVNDWLEIPAKKQTPLVFSNPISFKRKETKSLNCHNAQINVKPIPTQQYKPSDFASELNKKYLERNKEKKVKRNMWADLDLILKDKDKEIQKRLEQQSLNNHDPNTD